MLSQTRRGSDRSRHFDGGGGTIEVVDNIVYLLVNTVKIGSENPRSEEGSPPVSYTHLYRQALYLAN